MCACYCVGVRPELRCIDPVPAGHGRRGARRPLPKNSDRPPHPFLSFACTSAPCVSSAATAAVCPDRAAERSGVSLRWNALAHTRQRAPSARVSGNVRECVRESSCVCDFVRKRARV